MPEPVAGTSISLPAELFEPLYRRIRDRERQKRDEWETRTAGKMIQPDGLQDVPVDQLPLETKEVRLIRQVLNDQQSLDQIVRASSLFRPRVVDLVTTLHRLGLLLIRSWDEESKTQRRKTQKLAQLKTKLDGTDKFSKIGAHWTDYGEAIDEAYDEVREELDELESYVSSGSREWEVLQELRQEAREAHEFLRNEKRRRAHRAELKSEYEMESAVELYADQLETLNAQQKGEELFDRCKRIVELEPNHELANEILQKFREARQRRKRPDG